VSEHLLSILVGFPILAAVVMMFIPRQNIRTLRYGSVGVMIVELALSLRLLQADYSVLGYHFYDPTPAVLVEHFGVTWRLGVDGISLWLVLLTTLLTPIALWASWLGIRTKIKEFAISFLLLEAAMIGTFLALDVFVFYVFWELMLVPMYLIVGIWGGQERVYAAVKFFLYTMVGSLLMLIAILYVANVHYTLTGAWSFDIDDLNRVGFPEGAQFWLFGAFALAFAIKVPMFPFHTWLPDAHVQAPTGGSVILAAVMLKLGAYGFIRFAMPLFPAASHYLGPLIIAPLAIIGIIYGAYCAWVQRDVKKLVAYSSVSHLGFVMLGLFARNEAGMSGAILQMVNHGISTGALFILVGILYERRHTRFLDEFGGLAKSMPIFATLFVIVAMSSIGLPGTNGFIGEFMILAGTWAGLTEGGYPTYQPWAHIFALLAATGVILAAVYMLHALLRMFWGPITKPANETLRDVSWKEGVALAPLVLFIFWIGLFPNMFLQPMQPSVTSFIRDFQSKLIESGQQTEPHLVTWPRRIAEEPEEIPEEATAHLEEAVR
jgi:NADH-quinone oxidoreductase subunit M